MKAFIKKLYKYRIFFILINKIYNFYLTSKLNPALRGHKIKYLKNELDFFMQQIKSDIPFALVRYGDGERAIMCQQSIKAQEGWESSGKTKLGIDLLASLNISAPNFFHAFSCPCCDKEAYYWYFTRINNPNKTFANLFINANFPRFKKELENLKKDCVLIANYRARGVKIGKLNIKKHYEIDDDCIKFWEESAPNLIKNIKNDFRDSKNLLFLFSAGPMSCVMIKELFLWNPNNIYVDVGSAIDCYYNAAFVRPYMDKYSLFGSRNCYFYRDFDPEVSVVLTLYKRPKSLESQVEAILNQSLKPKEILLFIDSPHKLNIESSLDSNLCKDSAWNEYFKLPSALEKNFSNIIQVKFNVGVWGRFSGGLLAKNKYICFFDDDTIPAHRWLESCHSEILKKDGIYGAIGILSNNLSKYPFDFFHRTIGWNSNPPFALNNKKTTRVDFIGHSWFLKKDYLGAMWINANEFYKLQNVGEDAFLSYSLKKYFNLNSYIPPHEKREFFSSIKGLELGKGNEAVSSDLEHLKKMNRAIKMLQKRGFKECSFNPKWFILSNAKKILEKFLSKEKLEILKNKIKEKK